MRFRTAALEIHFTDKQPSQTIHRSTSPTRDRGQTEYSIHRCNFLANEGARQVLRCSSSDDFCSKPPFTNSRCIVPILPLLTFTSNHPMLIFFVLYGSSLTALDLCCQLPYANLLCIIPTSRTSMIIFFYLTYVLPLTGRGT